MATEIERKFLVKHTAWEQAEKGNSMPYRQGYIHNSAEKTVRVRTAGDKAFLTIKGPTKHTTRAEFEYAIPLRDAEEMLDMFCTARIDKTRYTLQHDAHTWEVDVFHGANEGLIVAEIELQDAAEKFSLPEWVDEEVTGEEKYYNACLSVTPFTTW